MTASSHSEPAKRPQVSFAIPVRNGEGTLPRALDSLLAQDFADFEVVLSDNASTDGTEAIARDYAARDARFRYHRNPQDIGQIENFNAVVGLSRGHYVRWLGVDDYLEPAYTSRCVAALDAHPEAVGVTTLWKLVDDDGVESYREYAGPRADSTDVNDRLRRTLWFLQAHRLYFDPIYSMLRRSALDRTHLLPIDPWTDRLLAVELCLAGPFCHVHECLATRRDAREPASVRIKRYHDAYAVAGARTSDYRLAPVWTMYAAIARVIRGWPLAPGERRRALASVLHFWIRAELRRPVAWAHGFLRRRLGH